MVLFAISVHAHPIYCWATPERQPSKPAQGAQHVARNIRTAKLYRITSGRLLGDAMSFGVFSQRFVDALLALEATGCSTFQVRILKSGTPISGYCGLRAVGKGGPLDRKRSRAEFCGKGVIGYTGIFMHEESWDGSDVFRIPELGASAFLSERVGNVLARRKWTNLCVIPASRCVM